MVNSFGKTLARLRKERGLSQQELADLLYVTRPAVANWEAGNRMPTVNTFLQIAQVLKVETNQLLAGTSGSDEIPNVVLVEDNAIALEGMLPVLKEALPEASVVGLSTPMEARNYFATNPVALAFLDIELGKVSGLDLCQELLRIQPNANVVFLTAYRDYALDAWGTDACGFLLKPLVADDVRRQIPKLRHPIRGMRQ